MIGGFYGVSVEDEEHNPPAHESSDCGSRGESRHLTAERKGVKSRSKRRVVDETESL